MQRGRLISAGTNRSGTQRRIPGSAGNTATTERSAGGPADYQAGSDQGDCLLEVHQVVDNVQLSGDREEVMSTNVAGAVPEVVGVVDSGRKAVHPSPTDYNPSRMPRTVW